MDSDRKNKEHYTYCSENKMLFENIEDFSELKNIKELSIKIKECFCNTEKVFNYEQNGGIYLPGYRVKEVTKEIYTKKDILEYLNELIEESKNYNLTFNLIFILQYNFASNRREPSKNEIEILNTLENEREFIMFLFELYNLKILDKRKIDCFIDTYKNLDSKSIAQKVYEIFRNDYIQFILSFLYIVNFYILESVLGLYTGFSNQEALNNIFKKFLDLYHSLLSEASKHFGDLNGEIIYKMEIL